MILAQEACKTCSNASQSVCVRVIPDCNPSMTGLFELRNDSSNSHVIHTAHCQAQIDKGTCLPSSCASATMAIEVTSETTMSNDASYFDFIKNDARRQQLCNSAKPGSSGRESLDDVWNLSSLIERASASSTSNKPSSCCSDADTAESNAQTLVVLRGPEDHRIRIKVGFCLLRFP
jgi:hypothetical protein